MNRSGLAAGLMQHSSPVQQIQIMMPAATGNPTCWWNTSSAAAPINYHQHFNSSSNLLVPVLPPPSANNNWDDSNNTHQQQDLLQQQYLSPADSWSQLLMSGLMSSNGDHEKGSVAVSAGGGQTLMNQLYPNHNETNSTPPSTNWQDNHHQMMQFHQQVKQEVITQPNICHGGGTQSYPPPVLAAVEDNHTSNGFDVTKPSNRWSNILPTQQNPTTATSSPQSSCVNTTTTTTGARKLGDFSSAAPVPPPPSGSSQCKHNSSSGGAVKKAKVSSSPSSFKVRKFGDRITSLHQLVSPFGKTDTASVLLEAIGYIRFLQSQIEALSLPYLSKGNGDVNNKRQLLHNLPNNIQGDQRNCLFPEDPGQLLNENCLKRKAAGHDEQPQEETKKDLRSRGLCLVPVSCTLQVGSENSAADYWAPAAFGGFGR